MLYYAGQFVFVLCAGILVLLTLGEKLCKKYYIALPILTILFLCLNYAVYLLWGDFISNLIFPVTYLIIPAIVYRLLTGKNLFHTLVAVLVAYISGQPAWFFGELALRFTASFNVSALVVTGISILFTLFLCYKLKDYQLPFFNGSKQKTVEFAIIPILFFLFDFFTALFPGYFRSENQLTTQIMPTVISFFYFGYLIIYVKEISIEKETLGSLTRESIIALSNAVELNDFYTSGHSRRVAEYSKEIAKRMKLSSFAITEIYYAGLLHDVGKIGIDNNIINKNGKLSDVEYQVMKNHPSMGFRLLSQMSKNTEFKKLAAGALSHHERFDGKGYPYGTAGEDIPLVARIIAVADAYDAMTSYRSYRDPLPQSKVRAEIEKGLGTQFDSSIGKILLKMIDEDTDYKMRQFTGDEKVEDLEEDGLEEVDVLEEA